ncbi:MAG: hypothetical protein AB1297_04495 [bacterium]
MASIFAVVFLFFLLLGTLRAEQPDKWQPQIPQLERRIDLLIKQYQGTCLPLLLTKFHNRCLAVLYT